MSCQPPEKYGVIVVGGGLAGCEAAWQTAQEGLQVILYEMKPRRFSPAHQGENLAELVCSNSFRGAGMNNAVGCLKEELRRCGSLFMAAADACRVPAGGSLAVDRDEFSAWITGKMAGHPLIEVRREEVTEIPEGEAVIIASGPLTSETLTAAILRETGEEQLYFYDAIAPIVEAESVNYDVAWWASRYDKGGKDYLNCPLNKEEYLRFVDQLCKAEKIPFRDFEKGIHFEGCMPIEVLAERGAMTLAFGAMKPVGLPDPRTGREPFAVLQLRQENRRKSLFNMVGFQTKLTYPEQRRIFRTIPGLENASFARLGSMHRNTFINAPRCLHPALQLRSNPRLFFAGQITGVEGYVESAGCGFLAGIFAARYLTEREIIQPPATTALGALISHLSVSDADNFQPMNVNYGLFPPLEGKKLRKRTDRRLAMAERALQDVDVWWKTVATQRRKN